MVTPDTGLPDFRERLIRELIDQYGFEITEVQKIIDGPLIRSAYYDGWIVADLAENIARILIDPKDAN